MSKQGFIYKYTFPNGKIYIGQTRVSVKERHYQHMSASKDPNRSTLCEMAIAKYGEPILETIETIEVKDNESTKLVKLLNEAEKKWIQEFKSTTKEGRGYNVLQGGEIVTPEEFILQEKWYDIFEKDRWAESIAYVEAVLESIGNKLIMTKEKLTKEERGIWCGYKFMDQDINRETTFYSFYKRNKDNFYYNDIGDYPYEVVEILSSPDSSKEEKERAKQIEELTIFEMVIKGAINDHWIEDIRQTIWKQIMKKKDKIIAEWYKKS